VRPGRPNEGRCCPASRNNSQSAVSARANLSFVGSMNGFPYYMKILGGVYQRIKSSLLNLQLLPSQHYRAFFAQGVSRGGYFDTDKVLDYLIYCGVEH